MVENEHAELGVERIQAKVALDHLERALAVVDGTELPLEIGARIQHAIDTLLPWSVRQTEPVH